MDSAEPFDVVILGGGWSGLLMLKHALGQGLRAVVLEARDASGGVWRFAEDPSIVTVMASTEMTSSTCFTEMADFPMPMDKEFMKHDEVLAYLERYVAEFGLAPHIREGHRVLACEKDEARAIWRVTTSRGVFFGRNLGVATGVHQKRNTDGEQQLFGDRPMGPSDPALHHMGELKRVPSEWNGKRVLVFGGGESASDLIDEVLRGRDVAQVTWSIPNGQHFFRKYGYWVRRHPLTGKPTKPQAFDKQSSLLQGFLSPAYKGKDGMRWGCKWTTSGSLLAYQGHGVPEWRSAAPNMHAFINKSANVLDHIRGGRLVPKGAVATRNGTTFHFRDGTTAEADVVILCTGYLPDFPFLPESIRRTKLTDHYKYVFCNDDPSVQFIGFARPIFGSIPMIAEVQSRWIARVLSGDLRLPERASRLRKTQREKEFWEHFFKDTSRRISTLVDVFIYTYGIGRLTGEFPDRWRLLREDPWAWWLSIVGPFGSAMLALNDPKTRRHAKEMLDHHRLVRWDTMPYMSIQIFAKVTRADAMLTALEGVKYELQRSPRVQRLAATRVGRAVNAVLELPKRLLFVDSTTYPWRAPETAVEPAAATAEPRRRPLRSAPSETVAAAR